MAKSRSRFHAAIFRTVERELTVSLAQRPAYAAPFCFGPRRVLLPRETIQDLLGCLDKKVHFRL